MRKRRISGKTVFAREAAVPRDKMKTVVRLPDASSHISKWRYSECSVGLESTVKWIFFIPIIILL
jgi:hypothetical protein